MERNTRVPLNKSLVSIPKPLSKSISSPFREKVIAAIATGLTIGVVGLAIADSDYRPHFFTFANTFIAGYAGIEVTKRVKESK